MTKKETVKWIVQIIASVATAIRNLISVHCSLLRHRPQSCVTLQNASWICRTEGKIHKEI